MRGRDENERRYFIVDDDGEVWCPRWNRRRWTRRQEDRGYGRRRSSAGRRTSERRVTVRRVRRVGRRSGDA